MTIATWSDVLSLSFKNLWVGVIGFLPNLVVALVVVLLGWGIGVLLGRVVSPGHKGHKKLMKLCAKQEWKIF